MICCTCGNQSKFTISCYGNQKRRLPFLFCIRKRKWSLHHSRKQIGTVFINLWHLARNWHLLPILFSSSNAILFSLITCSKLQKSVMDILKKLRPCEKQRLTSLGLFGFPLRSMWRSQENLLSVVSKVMPPYMCLRMRRNLKECFSSEVYDRNEETKQKRTKMPKAFFSSNISLNDF